MTLLESENLLREIFRELTTSAASDWTSLNLTVLGTGSGAGFTSMATSADGSQSHPRLSTDGALACIRLREVMYQAGRGTWYTALFIVDANRACSVEYDYDSIPINSNFGETADDIRGELIEDHKLFPRDQQHLPLWHPCRVSP
jgi:hypothetical protein